MALPSDFQGRSFTDDYLDLFGSPLGGTIVFSPNVVITHVGDGPTVLPVDVTGVLDSTGHLVDPVSGGSLFLPLTDDAQYLYGDGTTPASYTVTFDLTDPAGRRLKRQPASYSLTVPTSLPDVLLRLRTQAPYGGTTSSTYAATYGATY